MGAVLGRLVRAEWTKLLTTRVWIGLLLGSCLLVGGFAVAHRQHDAEGSAAPQFRMDF